MDEISVDLGVKFDELVEASDELEEDQIEVFGSQIKLDLGTGSNSIHDLREPPIEVAEEVHEVVKIASKTSEEGKNNVVMGTGDLPVDRVGGGDPFLEDYSGDSFEKVGEINLDEVPQTPFEPVLSVPLEETPTTAERRKKRVKTLAGRTDLPWVRKLLAQQSQTSSSSHQSSTKQPTQPTCKSHRLAAQGSVRMSSSTKQGPPVIEEILSHHQKVLP